MTETSLSGESPQKVQNALAAAGVQTTVKEMPASTRTAKEAAATIGCAVAQIAKSLVFRASATDRAILVIASGTNRVNEALLSQLVGEPIERATPEFVRERTGFVIGGVPPIGHPSALPTWMDRDLLQFEKVWAAAGTPFAVFETTPADLERITGATVVDVKSK
jgi:prolyl-tRNA editing enzyme YbaK/EbsC (Cys-tRNA(Pro) deacylase)